MEGRVEWIPVWQGCGLAPAAAPTSPCRLPGQINTRGASAGLGSARGAPFAAWVIGREKHKYLVQTLGSGKFSNLSGNVSLSPFYIFFP